MNFFPYEHQSGMFIHATADRVADCLHSWGNEEAVSRNTRLEKSTMPLKEAFQFLDQRIFNPDRGVVIGMQSGWTAFFDNHSREFLAASELMILCQRLKTDTCFFSYDHSTATEHRGSTQFNYYVHVGGESPVKKRQVMLSRGGGWSFQQHGDPLPFEDLTAYARPKKRERLTPELLQGYGRAIGVPFWDQNAYGDKVFLLRWGGGRKPDDESTLRNLLAIAEEESAKIAPRRWIPHLFGRRRTDNR